MVTWDYVTRAEVLRAIQEYDRLLEGYQRVVTDDRSDDVRRRRGGEAGP